MRRFAVSMIVLTLLNMCLFTAALPSMQNVKIVDDGDNRWDESDNSGGKEPERHRRMNERELMGRKNDAQSKCGYEVCEASASTSVVAQFFHSYPNSSLMRHELIVPVVSESR